MQAGRVGSLRCFRRQTAGTAGRNRSRRLCVSRQIDDSCLGAFTDKTKQLQRRQSTYQSIGTVYSIITQCECSLCRAMASVRLLSCPPTRPTLYSVDMPVPKLRCPFHLVPSEVLVGWADTMTACFASVLLSIFFFFFFSSKSFFVKKSMRYSSKATDNHCCMEPMWLSWR